MAGLEKKVFHDCELPDVPAGYDYRFTCPDCGSTWSAWRESDSQRMENYGFLGLRTRVVQVAWFADHRTFEWQSV